jgi:hypothetical protein
VVVPCPINNVQAKNGIEKALTDANLSFCTSTLAKMAKIRKKITFSSDNFKNLFPSSRQFKLYETFSRELQADLEKVQKVISLYL